MGGSTSEPTRQLWQHHTNLYRYVSKHSHGWRRAKLPVVAVGLAARFGLLYLRMKLRDRARITLVSDQDHFLFKPNTIYIPFGLPVDKLTIPLQRPTHRRHIDFVQTRAPLSPTMVRTERRYTLRPPFGTRGYTHQERS